MRRVVPYLVTALTAVLAAWALWHWLSHEAPPTVALREATAVGSLAEAAKAAAATTSGETDLAGCFKANREIPPGALAGSWPGFRGPARDNVASESGRLAETWGSDGPRVIWSIDVGDGHAMPALWVGNLYVLDYDEARGGDCLRCLNADTGQERWEHLYAVKTKRNHGISRTVVATDGDAVVSIGPQCHVLCLDARDGRYRWGITLTQRYGTKVPLWYTGQCPLIDGGLAILAPAGTNALLVGVDLKSGETVFETPNPGGLAMSHASVMVLTAEGVRQYVYAALGGIVGVAADGEERGRLLWHTTAFSPRVVAPSPVPLGDGRFFMTAGYGSGGAMFRVSRTGAEWRAELLFKTDRKHFASEQQTPVFHGGRLYTVLPGDGGGERQQFVCMTPEGERLWASGPSHTFGLGPYLLTADGLAVLLDDVGTLTLARVGPEGFRMLARHALMGNKGRDAWGPMILVNGRLFLRDSTRLYCLDLRR
ncbi:MAG TPA: PQQ-binding-like beta-propeller repeat protein [Kiritimatiellia bacterium]|nr:PQQ-binding-like beta-propeller repeat protein [Kiritimatiellia bacterium]HRU70928.1 PQQ-binding-like beta-propeller repeat protein [Kiritimatiellia bacterium]